jgi:hypothetical protein
MQQLRYRHMRSVIVLLLVACGVCAVTVLEAGEGDRAHAQEEPGRAWVRLVHASPDTTTADVYMDGASTFRSVGYGRVTKYVEVAAGVRRVTAYPVGTRSNRILDTQLSLDAGEHSTLVMIKNPEGEDPPVILLPLPDDPPPAEEGQPGMARLRLLNVANASPAVDLLDADDEALASDVDYGASADSFVEPGPRRLKVRGPDDMPVDAALEPFNLEPDKGYTLIAIDRGRDQQALRAVPLADGSDDETVTLAQIAGRTPTRTPTPARTAAAGSAAPRPAATKTPAPARPSVKVSIDRGANATYIMNEFMEICATVNQRATVRLSYRSGVGALTITEDVIVDRGCVWYNLTPRTTGTKSIRADMVIDGKVVASASVRFRLIDYVQ